MSVWAKALSTELECSRQNDTTGSPSNRNEGETGDEDEDEDVDFNPFLKGTVSPEASSSLSSEIEEVELDRDIIDSQGNNDITNSKTSRGVIEVQGYTVGGSENLVMQSSYENITPLEVESAGDKENGSISGVDVNDTVVGDPIMRSDDDDLICRRTRARYSLAGFSLEELETFLQDDDDYLQNADEEQEYKKFLAAFLTGKEGDDQTIEHVENDDDDDEDFEIELEEMLDSDLDEGIASKTHKEELGRSGRRPQTRQNRRHKAPNPSKRKLLEQPKKPLRPLIPILPNGLVSPFLTSAEIYPSFPSSAPQDGLINGFTPHQIGQLHCLIYEHVQLLIQNFSLCILDPSRPQVASQLQGLIVEILGKCNQTRACRTEPYPSIYFRPPYACSSVPFDSPQLCPVQCVVDPLSAINGKECSPPNIQVHAFQGQVGSVQRSSWVPSESGPVLSVLDVAPLSLVERYMDDVRSAVAENRRRYLQSDADSKLVKEPLFSHPCLPSSFDATNEVVKGRIPSSIVPSSNQRPPKKTLTATLVEKTKQQSIALVPKEIAKIAQRFLPLFNSALFPHKPPLAAVANRVLFTDSEDELLALGLLEYNSDWKAIQQRFLPCKSKHQIFVRQKNRCSSKAAENPIKAVRRMKTSPLTAEEREAIHEGLRLYKLDWISVWKFVVPHRDPSLLPRQWRIAHGTQKSYKQDPLKKEKRRMYDLKRRLNASESENRQLASDKEDYPAEKNGENDSGDNNLDNTDKSFVHEAFLADWRPCTSYLIPSQRPCLTSQEGTPLGEQLIYGPEGAHLFRGQIHENSSALKQPQHPNISSHLSHGSHSMPNTVQPNSSVSNAMSNTSKSQAPLLPYRARRTRLNNPHLVRLAPHLPPVNLPPSVRVIPHSAFKGNSVALIPHVANSGPVTLKSSKDKSNQSRGAFTNSPEEGSQVGKNKSVVKERVADSDLQLHPLLFQAPEDGRLPYYSLNCGNAASSSFSFFTGNQPQLNLSLFHNTPQAQHVVDRFNKYLKSKEPASASSCIDFHPLLQRTDCANSESAIARLSVNLACRPSEVHDPRIVMQSKFPASDGPSTTGPENKADELDLEIHLSSSRMGTFVENEDFISFPTSSIVNVQNTSTPHPSVDVRHDINRSIIDDIGDQSHPEIVMEQEELSDSDEEMEENVEFECEEMADSEGDVGLECEELNEMHDKEIACSESEEVAIGADCEYQRQVMRTSRDNAGELQKGRDPLLNLGRAWLSLNSSTPSSRPCMKTQHEGPTICESKSAPNSALIRPSRFRKKIASQEIAPQQHADMPQRPCLDVPTVKECRKRGTRGITSTNTGPTPDGAGCDDE